MPKMVSIQEHSEDGEVTFRAWEVDDATLAQIVPLLGEPDLSGLAPATATMEHAAEVLKAPGVELAGPVAADIAEYCPCPEHRGEHCPATATEPS